MYRKIALVDYDVFMAEFFPEAAKTATASPGGALSEYLSSLRRSSRTTRKVVSYKLTTTRKPLSASNPFAAVSAPKSDDDMYRKITSALNKTKVSDEFGFVSTPQKAETTESWFSQWAVKCGMYPKSALHRLSPGPKKELPRMDWSLIELAVACKADPRFDPFDETTDADAATEEDYRNALEQLMSYVEYIFHYQHRTCLYMLLFLGNSVRIVRIDRSGIFATHKLDYREEGEKLAKFLYFYSRCSAEGRGHDPTAVRLDPASPEAERMKARAASAEPNDYAANTFKASLDPTCPWWRLEVSDEHDSNNKHYFLVGKPHFQASGVIGRVTRGYVALDADPSTDDLVYLKDAWRVVKDNVNKEGSVLETLRAHNVKDVPTLICHGDVLGQKTRSQDLWSKLNPGKRCHLKLHQHYRLAVKEIGKSLDEFSNGRQLLIAICFAVAAHGQAYNKGILHGDLSPGNILLYQTPQGGWKGLLNDWEFSKQLSREPEANRTGTWEFMSVAALNNDTKPIVIQDELESFFHIILNLALRLLPHNCPESEVPRFLYDYFDRFSRHSDGHLSCGQLKTAVMQDGCIRLSTFATPQQQIYGPDLRFMWPGKGFEYKAHPLNHLLSTLLSWFSAYYELRHTPVPCEKITTPRESDARMLDSYVPARDDPDLRELFAQIFPDEEQAEAHSTAGEEPPSPSHRAASPSSLPVRPAPIPSPTSRAKARREQWEALAKNLESHGPILEEMERAILQRWPRDDRCQDRVPDCPWTVPKDQVPLPLPQTSKRGASVLDESSSERPIKRRKH